MKREHSALKGCQKKILQIKSTNSMLFEEAYFILKPTTEEVPEDDIVKEAERLLKTEITQKKEKRILFSWMDLLLFLAGALLSVMIFCILQLFL
ncbi:MAG: hypothetical protein IJW46_05680 [Clostridia bacterium]|nr:hypothetical protein [Clostridia bacterium]